VDTSLFSAKNVSIQQYSFNFIRFDIGIMRWVLGLRPSITDLSDQCMIVV